MQLTQPTTPFAPQIEEPSDDGETYVVTSGDFMLTGFFSREVADKVAGQRPRYNVRPWSEVLAEHQAAP